MYRNAKLVHVPATVAAAVIDLLFIVFIVTVFRAINAAASSTSDELYALFPFIVPAFLLREWLAARLS